jgi:hypothetical protein
VFTRTSFRSASIGTVSMLGIALKRLSNSWMSSPDAPNRLTSSCSGPLRELPPSASVILFRDRQFALRGVVDDEFVAKAQHTVKGKHWTVVRTSPITMGSQSWFHHTDGNALDELEQELRDSYCWGWPVAVGEEPNWHDLKRTIEAVVPGPGGAVKSCIY